MAILKFLKNKKKNEKNYNTFMSQFIREINRVRERSIPDRPYT